MGCMKRSLLGSLAGATLLLIGCSSSDEFNGPCTIGQLTGTWRMSYRETNGTCGPVADETVILGSSSGGASLCTTAVSTISADKCRMDLDFTCPLATGRGSQHWVQTMRQTGADKLEGTGTVQVVLSGTESCRSTYAMTVVEL